MYYILDDNNNPIQCTIHELSKFFIDYPYKRVVNSDEFFIDGIKYLISTVFLGLNHNSGNGTPILWETMIFAPGEYYDQYQQRYTSHIDAVCGHKILLTKLKSRNTGLYDKKTFKLKLKK